MGGGVIGYLRPDQFLDHLTVIKIDFQQNHPDPAENSTCHRGNSTKYAHRAHCLFLAKINGQHEEDFRYHFGSNFSVSTNQI